MNALSECNAAPDLSMDDAMRIARTNPMPAGRILLVLFGFPLGIVAREMDNPYLHRWFFETRQQFGHRLFLKRGGFDGMAKLMQAGGNLGLLCDQDAGHRRRFLFLRPICRRSGPGLEVLGHHLG